MEFKLVWNWNVTRVGHGPDLNLLLNCFCSFEGGFNIFNLECDSVM